MTLLILGLIIWIGFHLIPSAGQPIKQRWLGAMGDKGYQASYSIIIVISLLMIIFGWRSSTPTYLYTLPPFTHTIAMLLMVAAFICFGAAKAPTRLKQYIRHPQLTSVILWSAAHLMLNGDSRSVVLFGSMGVWAIVSIYFINQREGEWIKPDIPSWAREARGHAISLIILIVVVFLHPYIAGVPVR